MKLLKAVLAALLFLTGSAAAATPAPAKRIALTFDDAPRADGPLWMGWERTPRLIAALQKAGVKQAAFFVTTQGLESDRGPERLRAYTAAGHVLANHSNSHLWLKDMTPGDYIADLDKAQTALGGFDNVRPWYRFPFLDEGRTPESRDAVRAALKARGLKNGYVTVDNYDWYLDDLLGQAHKAGRNIDMDALRKLYVDTMMGAVRFYDGIAVETLGRSPAHVLLLHETDLNALFVGDLVTALRREGWTIVTADEAFADPIADEEPATLFNGQGRVAALAAAKGRKPVTLIEEREDEEVLNRLFEEQVIKDTVR